MNYIVIDIEASSLRAGSYPIEFAWGNDLMGIQSFLINPSTVRDWVDWDLEAEKIHKITKHMLLTHGVAPIKAWEIICALFISHRVYSDKPVYDSNWLKAFSKIGAETSIIRVYDTSDIIRRNLDHRGDSQLPIEKIYQQAAALSAPTHRAYTDVAYLLKAIEISA